MYDFKLRYHIQLDDQVEMEKQISITAYLLLALLAGIRIGSHTNIAAPGRLHHMIDSSPQMQKRGAKFVLGVLTLPPCLFLAIIVIVAAYVGVTTRGDASIIAARVTALAPHMLLTVQILLLVLIPVILWREGLTLRNLGWTFSASGQTFKNEMLIGVVIGATLGALYLFLFAPLGAWLQANLGDYVPPGQVLSTISSNASLFFLSNVLLAPTVEETLYRGYALTRLTERWGTTRAVLISCLFFGFLHWPGGIWYIALTGIVAGGAFAAVRLWRGTLITPIIVHATLNIIEFLFSWIPWK